MSDRDDELRAAEGVRTKQAEATQRFFDDACDVEDRLAAASSCGTFQSDENIRRGWAMVADAEHDPRLRAAAVNGLVHALAEEPDRIAEAIDKLADDTEPEALRVGLLVALQNTFFSSSASSSYRPQYLNVLRKIVEEQLPQLRKFALEYLALAGDDYVQRRLIEGLKTPERALCEPEVAIQLLANDLHHDAVPVLRDIVASPPNAASKREALRNLASDAQSAPTLEKVALDGEEIPEVRHLSAVGLFQSDPSRAVAVTRKVVEDESADDELRAAMLNTLTHLTPPDAEVDAAFDGYVAELEGKTSSEPLAKMARLYTSRRRG